jgi:hypothetical protein
MTFGAVSWVEREKQQYFSDREMVSSLSRKIYQSIGWYSCFIIGKSGMQISIRTSAILAAVLCGSSVSADRHKDNIFSYVMKVSFPILFNSTLTNRSTIRCYIT